VKVLLELKFYRGKSEVVIPLTHLLLTFGCKILV